MGTIPQWLIALMLFVIACDIEAAVKKIVINTGCLEVHRNAKSN